MVAQQYCFECRSADIVTDYSQGDVVCRGCGLVLQERIIDETPEWRNFQETLESGVDKSRVGEKVEVGMEYLGLTTEVNDANVTSKTNPNSSSFSRVSDLVRNNAKLNQLAATDDAEKSRGKRLQIGLQYLAKWTETFDVSSHVLNVARTMLVELSSRGLGPRNTECICVAVLFLACRNAGQPRSLNEFVRISGFAKTKLGKFYKWIMRVLEDDNQKIAASSSNNQKDDKSSNSNSSNKGSSNLVRRVSTRDYLGQLSGALSLSVHTLQVSLEVASKMEKMGLSSGQNPNTVAAAIVFVVAAFTNTKQKLATIAQVSCTHEKTLKKMAQLINSQRFILFQGIQLADSAKAST